MKIWQRIIRDFQSDRDDYLLLILFISILALGITLPILDVQIKQILAIALGFGYSIWGIWHHQKTTIRDLYEKRMPDHLL